MLLILYCLSMLCLVEVNLVIVTVNDGEILLILICKVFIFVLLIMFL